jgi:acyl carrier protein
MDRETLLEELRRVLIDEIGIPSEKITLEANLRDDLGMDSLDMFELITTLEDRTNTKFDLDKVEDVRTVKDAIEHVLSLDTQSRR